MVNPLRKLHSPSTRSRRPQIRLVAGDVTTQAPASPARMLLLRARMAYPQALAEPDYGRKWSSLARLLFITGAATLSWAGLIAIAVRIF